MGKKKAKAEKYCQRNKEALQKKITRVLQEST